MAEEIKMRMARAMPEQVQRLREWFQKLEELLEDEKTDSGDYGRWISAHYHEIAYEWERILFGYDVLVDNVCDKSLSYLEYRPEIAMAFALANKVNEIREEAEAHRVDYNQRAEETDSTHADGYWKGRRDEAGHFRDRLTAIIEPVIFPTDPK
jgi:hypothetical protein